MFEERSQFWIHLFDEKFLYIVTVFHMAFLVDSSSTEEAYAFKDQMGSFLINFMLFNFAVNIVPVFVSMVLDGYNTIVSSFTNCLAHYRYKRLLAK